MKSRALPTIISTLLLLLLSGCASTRDSILLGAGMGAIAGGSVANLATNHSREGTGIGAITGASFGALLGYLGHKENERKDRAIGAATRSSEKPKAPRLTAPSYRSIWVPDKIEGDRYIEGHRVFIIEESGKWTND